MIPIAKPCFSGDETDLIAEVMKTGWVCQGPMVARFEEAVAKYTGAAHAVASTSCTTALHLAMLINNIGAGDDVICPSYSFIATANGIRYSGAQPQFVDIDPATLNIDPIAVESFIATNYSSDMRNKKTGNRLKGILAVHQIGIAADIDMLAATASKHGLVLMEDSACSIGSTYKGQPIGASGYVGTLSFHPRKVISCGEGGMILTKDQALADKAKVLRAHGASSSDFARHKAGCLAQETYDVLGYNYRMTDLQAAIGIKQLEKLDSFVAQRRSVAARYNQAFSKIESIEVIVPPAYATLWNYQSYPLRLKNGGVEERNAVMQKLEESGVSTRRGIPPIHKEPVYATGLVLPHTESVSERSFFLPIYPQLSEPDVEKVISAVTTALESVRAGAGVR